MKDLELRNRWYGRPDVINSIVSFCKYRETCFIEKIDGESQFIMRYKVIGNSYFFKKEYEPFADNWNINIFISVGKVSYPIDKNAYKERLKGYDLIFDFDSLQKRINLRKPKEDCLKLIEVLNTFGIPYSVIFSGRKGFQLRIFSMYMHDRLSITSRHKLFGALAQNLKRRIKMHTLDINQYLLPQLIKLPLSIVEDYVCMPLSREELINFNKKNYHLKKHIDKTLRFTLENNSHITQAEAKVNFKKFYDYYI